MQASPWVRRPQPRQVAGVVVDPLGLLDQVADHLGQLGGAERHAADLRVGDDVDQVLRPQQHRQLPEVHLRDQHLVVAPQHVPEVRRERVQVPQMRLRDLAADLADPADTGPDRSVRRSPAEHQHLRRTVRVVDLQRRYGDPVDLGLPGPDHQIVVGRVVGDVAGLVLLLQTTDAVVEPRRTGDRPGARQRLRVAQVGQVRRFALVVGRVRARW